MTRVGCTPVVSGRGTTPYRWHTLTHSARAESLVCVHHDDAPKDDTVTTTYVSLPEIAERLGMNRDALYALWNRYRDHEDPNLRMPAPDGQIGDMVGWSQKRVPQVERWNAEREATAQSRRGRNVPPPTRRHGREVETARFLSLPQVADELGVRPGSLREQYRRWAGRGGDPFPPPDARMPYRRGEGGVIVGWRPERVGELRTWRKRHETAGRRGAA